MTVRDRFALLPLLLPLVLISTLGILAAGLSAFAQNASALAPGAEIWRRSYDGGGGGYDDQAADLVFAPKGYFYVVGQVTRTAGGKADIAVVRYSMTGARRWVRRYDDPAHEKDFTSAAVCDGAGNLYVTGYIVRGAYNVDLVLIKYSPSGRRLWLRTWDSAKHGDDGGRQLALDGAGNVYVAGTSQTDPADPTGVDLKLFKYDRSGHRRWVRSYDLGVGMYGDPNGLVIDKKLGRVYLGAAIDTPGADWQWLAARYSTRGTRRWLHLWGGLESDQARALTLAPDHSIYQVGEAYGGGPNGSDAAILRWTAAGVIAPGWPRTVNGPNNGNDHFYEAAVDRFGKVHAVGDANSAVSGDNALAYCYDSAGATLWSDTYYHAGAQTLWHVAVDPSGNTYAAGYSNESGANPAYLVMKWDGTGTSSWTRTAKESTTVTSGTDTAQDIGWRGGAYKGLYVTGNGSGDTTNWDWFTIRFEP
jgi:hypothetical protein